MAVALRTLLVFENKKLDRKYGSQQVKGVESKASTAITVENYGPNFRYVL